MTQLNEFREINFKSEEEIMKLIKLAKQHQQQQLKRKPDFHVFTRCRREEEKIKK